MYSIRKIFSEDDRLVRTLFELDQPETLVIEAATATAALTA